MKRVLLFALAGLLLVGSAYPQPSELALHLYGCGSLPNGDFAKNLGEDARLTRRAGFDIGEKVGLAQAGFGIGGELISPVWFRGLNWVFSTKLLINSADAGTPQSEFRSQLGDSVDLSFKMGQWINVPVMTGFRYDQHFTHKYTLYGMLQAGINFSKAPSRQATRGTLIVEDTRFGFARDFGFETGFGLLFDQTYSIGIRYLQLSSPRFEGTRNLSEKQFPKIFNRKNAILGEERSISMFVLTLGIQLFR